MRKWIIALVLTFVVGLSTTQAQQVRQSLTLTEDQLNAALALAVDNLDAVDSFTVDLSDGTVTVSAVVLTEDGDQVDASVRLQPTNSESGSVEWAVTEVSVNGFDLSDERIDTINEAIQDSAPAELREGLEQNFIIAVTIEDGRIIWDTNDELEPCANVPEGWQPGDNIPDEWVRQPGDRIPEDWEACGNLPENWEPADVNAQDVQPQPGTNIGQPPSIMPVTPEDPTTPVEPNPEDTSLGSDAGAGETERETGTRPRGNRPRG